MKSTLILLLAISAFVSKGQTFSTSSEVKPQPAFFVDSQQVDLSRVYLNPDNISTLNVVRNVGSSQYPNGEIYIGLKRPLPVFVTLTDISREKQLNGKNILYVINDSIVKDTTGIRLDTSYIDNLSLVGASDIVYLPKDAGISGILLIETKKRPTYSSKEPILRLR